MCVCFFSPASCIPLPVEVFFTRVLYKVFPIMVIFFKKRKEKNQLLYILHILCIWTKRVLKKNTCFKFFFYVIPVLLHVVYVKSTTITNIAYPLAGYFGFSLFKWYLSKLRSPVHAYITLTTPNRNTFRWFLVFFFVQIGIGLCVSIFLLEGIRLKLMMVCVFMDEIHFLELNTF